MVTIKQRARQALLRAGFDVRRVPKAGQARDIDEADRVEPADNIDPEDEAGRRRMTDLIARNATDEEAMGAALAALLHPGDFCVDVGANHGLVARMLASRAPGARHLLIEPIPELAAELRLAFPEAEVVEAAVGETEGETSFTVVIDGDGLSGVDPTLLEGWHTRTLRVAMTTLDRLVAGRQVAAIKIDVEGYELPVLRGAMETLRRSRPLVLFEHSAVKFTEDGVASVVSPDLEANREIFELVDGLGYRVFDTGTRGPLDAAEFRRLYETGERINFLAVS
jgi:FkbM family methyltransferase